MSARVCRLCGKPLSRMRANGDEFCSREHQNQFRLRQGMDRLMEANKVASLMRRRENPKPVNPEAPPPDTAAARRTFVRAQPGPAAENGIALPRRLPRHSWERAFASPPLWWSGARPAPAGRRAAGQAARFLVRRGIVQKAPERIGLAARFPQAKVALLRNPASPAKGKRRYSGMLRPPAFRISLGARVFHFRPADAPGGKYGGLRAGARPFRPAAREGRALRVSASAGFRLPALERRMPGRAPAPAGGRTALETRRGDPAVLALRAIAIRPSARVATAIGIPAPALACPAVPDARTAYGLSEPGARAIAAGGARDSSGMAARSSGPMWEKPDGCILPQPETGAAPSGILAAALKALRLPGAPAIVSERRAAGFVFAAQEPALGMPALTIQGVAIGAPSAKPRASLQAPKPASGSIIEEHFANGLSEWTGGVYDWKLDAAGVRTGSLALFRPSLELRDYDFEFLARIENRSVSWVFRAAGSGDYHIATIALAPDGGGYEFTHRTVASGAMEPASGAPVRLKRATGARQALTVRTRASGNNFTVWIDGKRVDQWTDSRLSAGGAGFAGTPEDRARLYWVKLSHGAPARSKA